MAIAYESFMKSVKVRKPFIKNLQSYLKKEVQQGIGNLPDFKGVELSETIPQYVQLRTFKKDGTMQHSQTTANRAFLQMISFDAEKEALECLTKGLKKTHAFLSHKDAIEYQSQNMSALHLNLLELKQTGECHEKHFLTMKVRVPNGKVSSFF